MTITLRERTVERINEIRKGKQQALEEARKCRSAGEITAIQYALRVEKIEAYAADCIAVTVLKDFPLLADTNR